MVQHFEKGLIDFHKLFQGGRCQAWQLEELLAKAIRSDFAHAEKVVWKGNGHDIDADIIINDTHHLQVKAGKITKDTLVLSGHRLGRFKGDFEQIIKFLNQSNYVVVAVPYHRVDDDKGITHIYRLFYIAPKIFKVEGSFEPYKGSYRYVNKYDVTMHIRPSMSWQIWWEIPIKHLNNVEKIMAIN